jgi:hypothetical protein
MRRLQLPLWHEALTLELAAHALDDAMRRRGGQLHLPVPIGIGDSTVLTRVGPDDLARAVAQHRQIAIAGPR